MARLEVDGSKSIYFEDLGGSGRAMILIQCRRGDRRMAYIAEKVLPRLR